MPQQPIEKGLPCPGLMAHVAVSKLEDHPFTVYHYTPTREKTWPEQFLGGWRSALQASDAS